MTRLTTAAALIFASGVMLAAQTTGTTPPQNPPKPPATPAPQTAAPPVKAPPVPFPAGAMVAYVQMQTIVAESKLGKCGSEQMKALTDSNGAAIIAKQKEIATQQQKMQGQQNLVSEPVLTQMQRDLERMNREYQGLQQEIQAKQDAMNADLANAFTAKVAPVVEAVRNERGLWMIFAADQSNSIAAANAGLDLSSEIVKRLDAAQPGPCTKKSN